MPAAHPPAHHSAAHQPARCAEHTVVRALNAARRLHGLAPLRLVENLSRVAHLHSRDLAEHNLLSHSGSDGTTFDTRIRRAVAARTVGETVIELGGRCTGRAIVRTWLRSPPHRVDVLAPGFGRVGVGRASIRGASIITADFASGH